MKLKFLLAALLAAALATTTVSAALLPAIPQPSSESPAVPEWSGLDVRHVEFADGVEVAQEGVFVLRTQEEYMSFQQNLAGEAAGAFPFVDFSSSFVVVTSFGPKDLGHDLGVLEARTDGERIVVDVDRQVDNPDHCRITHDVKPTGEVVVISQPSSGGFDAMPIGIVTTDYVLPYDRWYNCGCPEM